MNYANFIEELRPLIEEAKSLLGAEEYHQDPQFRKWRQKVTTLISRIEDRGYSIDCDITSRIFQVPSFGSVSRREQIEYYNRELQDTINELESIVEFFDKYGDPNSPIDSTAEEKKLISSDKVFIVHGHDEEMKQSVARFIEKLDLEPIILSEQPNQGRTIIEKFEAHSDVGYAVILLSPDDVGHPANVEAEKQSRARQNVILELGYFVGRLTRARVCALRKGEIELPSDIHGVLYEPFEKNNGWKLKLASEMKQAGLNVDLNKVI
ncbi:MAG: nucleotide-binding protein [Candidatus Thiodiazotropha taylori]|nr:nucleotide-binding protein [Candidatus Thiodiazotropha taylori]